MNEYFISDEYRKLSIFFSNRKYQSEISAVDELHGMLSAIIIGPDLLHPNEWLSLTWHGSKPFHGIVQANNSIQLILKMYKNVVFTLQNDRPLIPIFREQYLNNEHKVVANNWCYGFLKGVGLRKSLWCQYEGTELEELLLPILALGTQRKNLTDNIGIVPNDSPIGRELKSTIQDSIAGIYTFWRRSRRNAVSANKSMPTSILNSQFSNIYLAAQQTEQRKILH